jgi:hypothetical protein
MENQVKDGVKSPSTGATVGVTVGRSDRVLELELPRVIGPEGWVRGAFNTIRDLVALSGTRSWMALKAAQCVTRP